jgi:hypothetical protein
MVQRGRGLIACVGCVRGRWARDEVRENWWNSGKGNGPGRARVRQRWREEEIEKWSTWGMRNMIELVGTRLNLECNKREPDIGWMMIGTEIIEPGCYWADDIRLLYIFI